jgi:hypothetical protein
VRTAHDYLFQLRLSRFEGIADSELPAATSAAHVAASWEILRPDDDADIAQRAEQGTAAASVRM